MKKMKLDLDQLTVESFSPAADPQAQRGTVHGRIESADCTGITCETCDACTYNGDASCSGDHVCFCQLTPNTNC